ncbi:MAG: Gfo/Idh/MocA family oxidoreductase [Saprospiraceae bacterium]|nr:Gfo/Idh/MocA family oxidoreductase [Saprospiraceae bacterium]
MERRSFLKSSSLATAALFSPSAILNQEEKIKLGVVGVGWWANDFLIPFAQASGHFEVIGICDVDAEALETTTAKVIEGGGLSPKAFASYQDMYEMPGIEAIAIATPTHWHALQFIAACEKGLDVWLEKPISYDIREAQAMLDAHTKANNTVNVDFPRLYGPLNTEIKDFIHSGQAGEICQISFNIHNTEGYPKTAEIPPHLDYEKFCGPAPMTPYRPSWRGSSPAWRAQHDFSRGILADWGIHYLQNIRSVMDWDFPDRISAIGGITRKDGRENPDHLTVNFDFDGLPVQWTQKTFGYTPPLPHTKIGVFFYGDKATIFVNDTGWEVYPADGSEMKTYGDPLMPFGGPKHMELVRDIFVAQWTDFATGIRKKSNAGLKGTFHQGFVTTSCINYADFAYRSEQPVDFDDTTMDISNNSKAAGMLQRSYRNGYRHPFVG